MGVYSVLRGAGHEGGVYVLSFNGVLASAPQVAAVTGLMTRAEMISCEIPQSKFSSAANNFASLHLYFPHPLFPSLNLWSWV